MPLTADIQSLQVQSPVVELYKVDCTALGGAVYYVTPHTETSGAAVEWDGVTHNVLPISSTGWDISSSGTQPKPQITVSNITADFLAPIITLGDMVGAEVTRTRTFAKHLDGGSDPDTSVFFPVDRFLIEKKLKQDNIAVTWQLTSKLDRMGMTFGRKCLKRDFPGMSVIRLR